MTARSLYTVLVILFIFSGLTHAQEKWWKDKKYKSDEQKQKYLKCKSTFKDIESGLKYGNIYYINSHFEQQIYLDVIGTDKGYYSENQATQILTDFFNYFTPYSFGYYKSMTGNTYALAYGTYIYKQNSTLISLKTVISLTYNGGIWLADRIAIN